MTEDFEKMIGAAEENTKYAMPQIDPTKYPSLACDKPVASVHPEPGSNSPLVFIFSFSFFQKSRQTNSCIIVCCLCLPPELPERNFGFRRPVPSCGVRGSLRFDFIR